MAELVINIGGSEGAFAALPLKLLEDPTLSWRSKALWAYLRSRPEGWRIHEEDLVRRSTEGRDAIRTAVRELEAGAWLVKSRVTDGRGRYVAQRWEVVNPKRPSTENPSVDPSTGKPSVDPSTGKPSPGNPSAYLDTEELETGTSASYEADEPPTLALVSQDEKDPETVLRHRQAKLLGAFVQMFGRVDGRTRGAWAGTCGRIVRAWSDEEIRDIARGMRMKYPWDEGEKFTPFHMERHAVDALDRVRGQPLPSIQVEEDEAWADAMRGQG